VPLSILLLPPFTGSIVLAAAFQSYIAEEWIHHATHFYNFRDPYFRYMKKHHLYHHTSQGMTRGFGTSSGILDVVFSTRYPENVRERLYGQVKTYSTNQSEQPIAEA
jgi:sterol desaturase/sphingolipid hydroxylase (fatty acid hydroxylase superfamily)